MKNSFKFKKTAVILLAGSLLAACSCGGKQSADTSMALPETGEYTFSIPEDWTIAENTGLYSISAPVEDAGTNVAGANISVMNFEMSGEDYKYKNYTSRQDDWRPEVIEKYSNEYMQRLGSEFGTLEITSPVAPHDDISDMKACSVQYTIKDSFTDEVFFYESVFVLVPVEGKDEDTPLCYIITFTANGEENFNHYRPNLLKVVGSFGFDYDEQE